VVKFGFYLSQLKKQPFFANNFKIQRGLAPLPPFRSPWEYLVSRLVTETCSFRDRDLKPLRPKPETFKIETWKNGLEIPSLSFSLYLCLIPIRCHMRLHCASKSNFRLLLLSLSL